MDTLNVIVNAIKLIAPLLPTPKPPRADYTELIASIPRPQLATEAVPLTVEIKTAKPPPALIRSTEPLVEEPQETVEEIIAKRKAVPIEQPVVEESPTQQTACISCSRSHLSTVSGALGEACRFAREDGVKHPEVQRRIMLSEDEINIMERIDLAPDALAASPPEDRKLAEEYLPRIRKLRQDIGEISSLKELEDVAGDASILGQEFRLRALQLKGVDLSPIMEIANKVQAGEMDMETAKAKVREILPPEEEE